MRKYAVYLVSLLALTLLSTGCRSTMPQADPKATISARVVSISQEYANINTDVSEEALAALGIVRGTQFTAAFGRERISALLGSDYGDKKFQEAKKAHRKNTTAKGDYGDGKAKINSTAIRRVVSRLAETDCILIILSQTRDDIGAGMFDEQKTHSGGHALKFYATVQLWSSVGRKIKKTVNEREMVVGVHCRIKTKKNRLTGKERTVEVPIYYESGIDDLGAMVDYLTYWKFWPKAKGGLIDATGDFEGVKKRREELIKWLEDNDMREDLEDIVEAAWDDIEARLSVGRKGKYDDVEPS